MLQALAVSGDPRLEEYANRTLTIDRVIRRDRSGAGAWDPTRASEGSASAADLADRPERTIFDAQETVSLPGTRVRGEGDPATGDIAVSQAYDGLGDTWAFWNQVYDRDSLDGRGLPLDATVHYGRRYDNAFWDGSQMVFGDGDGVVFLGFTRSLDVIGHELAHGVTQYTSGLRYRDQSGALNESVSDVFGVLVKQRVLGQTAAEADWLVGAELLAPGVRGVAIRSMAAPGTAYDDPRLGRDPQPATMAGYVDTTDDNGGVHINSGIPNRAFHRVATVLGGFAWERAGQIWYDTITAEVPADCDFGTFARLTLDAATARYGPVSAEADAVRGGWDAVGLPLDVAEAVPVSPADATASGPQGDPGGVGPATRVRVRRTGGVAGITRQREVSLDSLPVSDAASWELLLTGGRLRSLAEAAAKHRRRPDAFSYTVACTDPEVEVELPEPAVPVEVRELLERTLGSHEAS